MSRRIALPGADELFRATGDSVRGEAARGEAARGESVRPVEEVQEARPEPRSTTLTTVAPVASAVDVELAPVSERDTEGLEEAAQAVRSTSRRRPRTIAERRPSGRERHDEKITVYVSADELMDLEHARLMLRGDHGLPVDRGRVVREALAVVLADFEAKGEASILVRRLRGR
ncbi:MAG: hypothetical protein JWM02_2470 [Frankiales bacterium]|nr:hypothetical protein [Frankiales bacterium]